VEIAKNKKTLHALAELLAVVFMGAVALAAQTSGFMLLLFPELAASQVSLPAFVAPVPSE